MGRNKVKQTLAAVLVVLMAAAPLSGAICTMSCSDGGGSCCCANPGSLRTVQVSAESCCGAEATSPAVSNLNAERITSGTVTDSFAALTIDAAFEIDGPADNRKGFATPARGQDRGRASPLFLLHASFLI